MLLSVNDTNLLNSEYMYAKGDMIITHHFIIIIAVAIMFENSYNSSAFEFPDSVLDNYT